MRSPPAPRPPRLRSRYVPPPLSHPQPHANRRPQPDQKFVIVSSRGENNLQIPAFAAGGAPAGARIVSDPLVSFSIDQATGALAIVQRAPAGGRNPRGFSINKAGTLVASALQDDNRVVVYARDVKTGQLGDAVAWATVGAGENNGPNYVIFDE